MSNGTDDRPMSLRIAAQLRAEIMAGDRQPGSKLPSTSELQAQFNASNQAVQNAIKLLKDEGYAVGERGKGVFVRPTQMQTVEPERFLRPAKPGEPYAWMSQAAAAGSRGSIDLLGVERVDPTAEVAEIYGTEEGAPVVCRRQLLRVDGVPVEFVRHYYPLGIAEGTPLALPRKIKGGSPALFVELGLPPRAVVDTVSTRPPTPEEFTALELPAEIPVLRTFRVVMTDGDRPIEVSVLVKAGHRHQLRYRLAAPEPTALD